MGWSNIEQEKSKKVKGGNAEKAKPLPMIKMPGCDKFVPIGKSQINRKYEDEIGPRLLIIIDEVGELLLKNGVKTESGKEEDALKDEIISIIQSLTQLGRSAGVHCILCTQRNDTSIIPGVIQNNSLGLNTKVVIKK